MKKGFYITMLVLLFYSCLKDDGNYNYSDVNNVVAEMAETYRVRLEDTLFVLKPEIIQSMKEGGNENLKFVWTHSTRGLNMATIAGDTVSTSETLSFEVKEDDKVFAHYFRLSVLDESTNIPYTFETTLQVVKPFTGAWMILHKQDNETRLGAIEYADGKGEAAYDVYRGSTGKKFKYDPVMLLAHNSITASYTGAHVSASYNMFAVITNNMDEAGVYFQSEKFAKKDSLTRMVQASVQSSFDVGKMTLLQGDQFGTICITDGTLFQGMNGFRLYKAKTDQLTPADVYLSHGVKLGYSSMFYDQLNRRFVWYNCQGNKASTSATGGTSYYPNSWWEQTENQTSLTDITLSHADNVSSTIADIKNVPVDREVLYMGGGFQPQKGSGIVRNTIHCYAYARGANGKSYVYVFNTYGVQNPSRTAGFINYYVINTPDQLLQSTNSCFTSGCDFNGIMFFSYGNSVYRLDFTQEGGSVREIYTHDQPGTITRMKIAKYEGLNTTMDYDAYGYDVYKSMGVAIDLGNGKSDFVVLNLSSVGEEEERQVYRDFGTITDMVFL